MIPILINLLLHLLISTNEIGLGLWCTRENHATVVMGQTIPI